LTIQDKAARIKLILFDVDGVLTDGAVVINSDGSESKNFFIRDGIAMVWAERAGVRVGLLSARTSPTTLPRARQLGLTLVYQGVSSKAETLERILADEHLAAEDVAYMGDDVVDLAVVTRVGFSGAPAVAVPELRSAAHWTSRFDGGRGAAREFIEVILKAQKKWDDVVSGYASEGRAAR
jgi:3-deoxy-D-manno-octulosonate 8-phosphate phosphatase (KDO 8-P phosphatase)